MGLLVEGTWHDTWYETKKTAGNFKRAASQFRNWVTLDASKGPTGKNGFKAEQDRYHLYVSYACPWAHRTLIYRKLLGLEDAISFSVVDHFMDKEGWTFSKKDGATIDHINGFKKMWQIYTAADPAYSGRVTVPILWDKKQNTIVSNESSEIIRMFNDAFIKIGNGKFNFNPPELLPDIDEINTLIYSNVNNGVYKCGFATTQEAYSTNFTNLFKVLDELDQRLENKRYLLGDAVTEADWRLFTTLVRFDPVYVGHFKCNKKRIADYKNLSAYLRDLYQVPGVAETVNMHHIKHHYYASHATINPTRIVPGGPEFNLNVPHGRG